MWGETLKVFPQTPTSHESDEFQKTQAHHFYGRAPANVFVLQNRGYKQGSTVVQKEGTAFLSHVADKRIYTRCPQKWGFPADGQSGSPADKNLISRSVYSKDDYQNMTD